MHYSSAKLYALKMVTTGTQKLCEMYLNKCKFEKKKKKKGEMSTGGVSGPHKEMDFDQLL